MPQAPTELTAKWGGYQGVGEDKAIAHLRQNFLQKGWGWLPRAGYKPTDDDYDAAAFLMLEWDWDGILDEEGK